MPNDQEPATKADLAEVKQDITQLRSEMQHMYDSLTELIRDNETKLLQAFYTFAESNQKRISAVEDEASALRSRLSTIEDRLTHVEKRLNMPSWSKNGSTCRPDGYVSNFLINCPSTSVSRKSRPWKR
jgi:hypothetical protein